MPNRLVLSLSILVCWVNPVHPDKPRSKQIDPEIVATYEKLGAKYGSLSLQEFGRGFGLLTFSQGRSNAERGFPSFGFGELPNGKLPKLPLVDVPFGLSLCDSKVTDAGLKELRGLKTIAKLDLAVQSFTDAGIKELKDLKNLTELNCACYRVQRA